MATEPLAPSPAPRFEHADAGTRGLFLFFVFMVCALVLIAVILAAFFGYLSRSDRPAPFVSAPFGNVRPVPNDTPLLQPTPSQDIRGYMQSQQHMLDSYGWIDRKNGIVRIPVDQAMRLILEEGLPVRPAQKRPLPAGSAEANPASARNRNPEERR